MKPLAWAAAFLALMPVLAFAQGQRQNTLTRPAWAASVPEQVPTDQVGMFAYLPRLRSSFCVINVAVVNNTTTTIRTAQARVEVFFGQRSVIGRLGFEYADPDRARDARISLVEGCQRAPTRIVIRDIDLCVKAGETLGRRACGVPWMQFVPALPAGGPPLIPVEFAPDIQ